MVQSHRLDGIVRVIDFRKIPRVGFLVVTGLDLYYFLGPSWARLQGCKQFLARPLGACLVGGCATVGTQHSVIQCSLDNRSYT